MCNHIFRRLTLVVLLCAMLSSSLFLTAFAADVYPVTGITVSGDGVSLSNGVVTDSQGNKWVAYNYTDTVTVKYTGTNPATVTFTYAVSTSDRGGTVTLNGTNVTGGTVSQKMENGDTVSFSMTSAKGGVVTLKLSGFSVVEIVSAKVTVTYDSSKGSVSLGGTAVASGKYAETSDGSIAAVATPVSGCTFLGWTNADTGELLSKAANATLNGGNHRSYGSNRRSYGRNRSTGHSWVYARCDNSSRNTAAGNRTSSYQSSCD